MALRNFGWLLFLASLWGPSFLFMKVAVQEIPPFTLVLGRVGIAALLLYLILRLTGRNLPKLGPIWLRFAVVGFFANALPFVLISWGEIHISSALAAILNGTTPFFTILLAHVFTIDDRLTPVKIVGTMVGFVGLVLLIAPSLWQGVYATTWGLVAVTAATASYGVGIVYTRLKLRGLPPLVGPTAQVTMATLYILPLSLWLEHPFSLPAPSWPAWASMLGLALLGTALAYVVYYYIIERTSATYVSMVTYLVPIFGVALGIVVLDEQPGWLAYVGCALILVGVMTVNGVFRFSTWRRVAGAAARSYTAFL
jgi:drug/metabolite transporter (DMT)-like permease